MTARPVSSRPRRIHVSLLAIALLGLVVTALASAPAEAQTPGGRLTGNLPPGEGLGTVVWGGGAIDSLEAHLVSRGCEPTSLWSQQAGGGLVGYIAGAPAVVNGSFLARHPDGDIEPVTPLVVVCNVPGPSCERPSETQLALLDDRVGFGRKANGGAKGCVYHVTNANDAGPGSLREGVEAGNRWVVFDGDFTVALNSPIRVANNTTIDGRGRSVTVTRGLYLLDGTSNVVVTDVTLDAPREGARADDDLLRVEDSTDWWFNHLTLRGWVDEYVDVARPGNGLAIAGTISWSRFEHFPAADADEKTILIGWDNGWQANNHEISVTIHHNWFDGTRQRHPLVTNARVHLYNNVITWRLWGLHVRRLGGEPTEVVSENDVYDASKVHSGFAEFGVRLEDEGNHVRISNPLLLNGARVASQNENLAFVPGSVYRYRADPVEGVAKLVTERSGAGARP